MVKTRLHVTCSQLCVCVNVNFNIASMVDTENGSVKVYADADANANVDAHVTCKQSFSVHCHRFWCKDICLLKLDTVQSCQAGSQKTNLVNS